jgi:hypothetical protein
MLEKLIYNQASCISRFKNTAGLTLGRARQCNSTALGESLVYLVLHIAHFHA